MAGLVKTYTGDLTQSVAKRIYEAALVGDEYRQDAKNIIDPEKAGVDDFKLNRGEFFGHALRAKATSWLPRRFQHQMPDLQGSDYLMRGQKRTIMSPFASPINPVPPTDIVRSTGGAIQKYTSGAINPSIVPNDAILGDMIDITPGRGRRVNPGRRFISAETGFIPDDKKNIFNKARGLFGQGVKVREEKLGKFLSAVAQSLSASLGSINKKMDDANEGIIIAKDGIAATHKQLEGTSDVLESKLDAIIDALRAQNYDAQVAADNQEHAVKEIRDDQKEDFDTTKEIQKADADQAEIDAMRARDIATDDRGVIDNPFDEPDVGQLSMPLNMGADGDGFARGGIASGPDSGYLARLHGNELIVPLDNNYTQGQPSAVDGVTRRPQYEAGTGGLTPKSTPIPQQPPTSTAFNFFNNRPSEHAGTPTVLDLPEPNMKVSGESLMKAMKLPFEVASLGIMQATGNAVRAIPGFDAMKQTVSAVVNPVAQAFSIKDTISGKVNNLLETKSLQTERRNQEVYKREQSENRRAWWDIFGLFRSDSGGEGGDPYGVGGPGLSSGGLQNLYHGTSNARAGKIFSGGFKPSNAMSWAGRGKSFLTPDFFDAAKYARPGATGLNPFSVKGLPGTGLNNLNNARGQVLNILQPRGAGLRLPGWLRNLGLAPEVAVNPKQATKGLNLSQKLLGGAYPNSSTANAARRLMTSPASGRGLGLMSKLSPMLRAGGGLLGKLSRVPMLSDMLFPDPTAQYDQMHGPNAYFNDPRFTGPRPEWAPPLNSGSKSAIVDMGSKEHVMNRLSKKEVDPSTFTVNNLDSANLQQPNEATSHIDNMGDSQVEQYQFVYSAFK